MPTEPIVPLKPINLKQQIVLRKPAADPTYKVLFFPNALTFHRLQQLHAAASGQIAAVHLPEVKKLNAAQAAAEYGRATLVFYSNLINGTDAAHKQVFNDLLAFLHGQRNPTGLAGAVLTALNYFVHAKMLPQVKVCLYLLGTKSFQSELASYGSTKIIVCDLAGKKLGVSDSKHLSGLVGSGPLQQATLANAGLSGASTSASTSSSAANAVPFGGLNIDFGTAADGLTQACVGGAVVVGAVLGFVIAAGGSAGTAGSMTPATVAAGAALFTSVSGSGTAACLAMFPNTPPATAPAPSAPSQPIVVNVTVGSVTETVTVTPSTGGSDGGSDGGSQVSVTVTKKGTGTDGGPDGGPIDGGASDPEVTGISDPGNPTDPENPDGGGDDVSGQVCTPGDPSGDYSPAGGFEAGDWTDNSKGDTSGGKLNFGGIPSGGDTGSGDGGSSTAGSAVNLGGKGGGDPLDVGSYGGETLNTSFLNRGNSDPRIGTGLVTSSAIATFASSHLAVGSMNANLLKQGLNTVLAMKGTTQAIH